MSARTLLFVVAMSLGLTIAGIVAAPPAGAEPAKSDMVLLLDTIRANRRALISVNLNLTAEEAAKFWPLYDRYQQEMNTLGDRLAVVVEDYTTNFRDIANERALQLMKDYLAAEADRVQVRRTYIDQFAAILPGRTVARFFQIENKMDAVVRYDLAATIPVVDEPSAPAAK